MKLATIAVLLLLLSACAASTGARTRSGTEPTPHTRDQGCVDDCLGNGGNRSFCEDRCSY